MEICRQCFSFPAQKCFSASWSVRRVKSVGREKSPHEEKETENSKTNRTQTPRLNPKHLIALVCLSVWLYSFSVPLLPGACSIDEMKSYWMAYIRACKTARDMMQFGPRRGRWRKCRLFSTDRPTDQRFCFFFPCRVID